MASTRRLAAILAADVAGYSRLMGVDEEGTHERLKAHLREVVDPKIAEHRGRIVKNTGDGMLAEFASVVDAVRCAVEVQRRMIDREPDVPEERRRNSAHWRSVGDTGTSTGRLMLAVLGGLADVERDLIRTRTAEGRSRAQRRGQHMGRPSKLTPQQQTEARRRRAEGATLAELARSYGVGKSTISRLAE
jgi:hypothetical protein